MFGVILIIAYPIAIEFVAIILNRSIVKNVDMMANTYIFSIRYTNFSIFFNIVMCGSLIAFAYFFITSSGGIDSRSITSIILFVIGTIELLRNIFFKIEISSNLINFKGIIRRTNYTFDDIKKVEAVSVFDFVMANIFSEDKKLFVINNTMAGYRLFMERLQAEEGVEWMNVAGSSLDKSDM